MNTDGWEVNDEVLSAISDIAMVDLSDEGDELDCSIRIEGWRGFSIPVAVVRRLINPCCDLEGREVRSEMLAAVALLTGTRLEPCGPDCPGHLSKEAHAQIKAAQVGWTAEGALPWRPAVGEGCLYFSEGAWVPCVRIAGGPDRLAAFRSFAVMFGGWRIFRAPDDYDGIRPVGSLPVPASARAKMPTATAAPEGEPTILVEPPGGESK